MRALLAALLALTACPAAWAYSVMAHEAIIDAAWNDSIRPLLLKRFPGITAGEIQQAQAYGYGGAIIQDMGYYPFGNKFFSNLTHYVRSGEFVLNLLGDARDVKELAFALGALAHYVADSYGHPQATNRVVPIMYPKLKEKFGPVVTYEDSPAAHLKVEFSFDVVQVAQGDYAPQAYHDHIGFEVKNIDAFVGKLQAAGIKTDGAIRNSANASGLRIVYVTDPWGTEIEITEGLATTPTATGSR